jgi:hypothetical protein
VGPTEPEFVEWARQSAEMREGLRWRGDRRGWLEPALRSDDWADLAWFVAEILLGLLLP